ncbi:MAG: Ig-like domain-containing protein [Solirubrobacteraceae bacterium]
MALRSWFSSGPLRTAALIAAPAAALALAPAGARATAATDQRCVSPSQLVNGSFEVPRVAEGSGQVYPAAANSQHPEPGIGWSTITNDPQFDTDAERILEIWGPESGNAQADDGDQFAEMAANHASTLFQDIATIPGTTMHWRLAHRAREGYGGPDVMHLDIGAPGGPYDTQVAHNAADGSSTENDTTEIADTDDAWGHWSGSYTVPAGQTTTRFAFAYVSSTSGDGGGNWLDGVVFTLPATACDDTATVAQNGTVDIDVAANDPGDEVVVSNPHGASHGTVAMVGGKVRYIPANGYSGADSFTYTLTDGAGSTDTANVAVTVVPPPVATAKTSTGAGTAQQSASVTVLAGQTLKLVDDGDPVDSILVPGKGTFSVAPSGDTLLFQPVAGYTGSPTPATYKVTDAFGGTASSTYAPTVTLPAAPSAPAKTSTGTGTAAQTATFSIPSGGSVRLRDGNSSVTSLEVTGQGSYALDTDTGIVTFTPVLGFHGPATPITYRVTDAYEQSTDGTYTPTVTSPTGPSAPAKTSTGTGTATQTVTLAAPTGGHVRLYDGTTEVTTLTVTGEGTYTLNTTTNVVSFVPVLGFHGTASSVAYRVTDAYGQTTDGTSAPSVTSPAPPLVDDVLLSGTGVAPETDTLPIPTGGHVRLLDGTTPATTVTVPNKGTFVLDTATGVVTFTPVLGFAGTAAISFRVTDAYGQDVDAELAAVVVAPARPTPTAKTSTGVGTTPQSVTVTLPDGGRIELMIDDLPSPTLDVPGKGTFSADRTTGKITFTAVNGYVGAVPAVTYRVTDAYEHFGTATYTATVTAPPVPAPASESTTGPAATAQSVAIPIPTGGSITLLGDDDQPVDTVTVAGQGTYTLDRTTGQITFTPVAGFSGTARSARFAVTDAYGQRGIATFAATVAPPVVTPAPPAATPTPASSPAAAPPAAVCTRTRTITLHWTVPGVTLKKVVVTVDGKTVRSLAGSKRSTSVTLKAVGPQRFTVKITGTAKSGAKYVSVRDYRLCNPNYEFVDVKSLRLKKQK